MAKKVISTRMDAAELAKARDGLLKKGIDPSQIENVSQILRLTFYYGLLFLCPDPSSPASEESLSWISQRIGQNKTGGPITLNDIIKQK